MVASFLRLGKSSFHLPSSIFLLCLEGHKTLKAISNDSISSANITNLRTGESFLDYLTKLPSVDLSEISERFSDVCREI